MNFLRRLFGSDESAGSRPGRDRSGLYFYVRSHRCDEVIEVRLDRAHDLSIKEFEPMTYYARKVIVGTECFDRMEADFYFDANKRLIEKSVSGGEFVEYEDYQAYQESKKADPNKENAAGEEPA